jgi:geranylgeranyl diphosphate synthase, type I
MQSLSEFKKEFDPLLEEFLGSKISEFESLTTDSAIKQFVSYSKNLIAEGKRLRPYLAYLMYKAYGGKEDKTALNLFISLEIFHLFALVHDDIMDRATTRRNEKTLHRFIFEKLDGVGNLEHIANSQAILVGDLLVSWALENFRFDESLKKENFDKARQYFYQMIDEVILGQMLDVDIATEENAAKELIDEKTRLKTSRYTCVRPMQLGAALADINYHKESFLEELGTKVGIAFQLQDDLLSIIGNSSSLTKDILIDIEEHQHTFFTNYLLENASEQVKQEFQQYFGKKLSLEEKEKVKQLFIESGSIEAGKKIITQMLKEAKNLVSSSNFENEYKQKLDELLEIMEKRQS